MCRLSFRALFRIIRIAFQTFEMGYASSLAMVLFLAVLLLTVIQFLIRKRWVFNET